MENKALEILKLNADNLKQQQYLELKEHVVKKLFKIADLIRNDQYDKVLELTQYSPAGDGMGCDNHFIDFDWSGSEDGDDIKQTIEKLNSLKKK